MSVSYIPLGQPFLKTLVTGLLGRTRENPENLMDYQVILPTRRAVREIIDIFLDVNDGRPVLLPKLHAVADVDDQELDLLIASVTGAAANIPPAISALEREMVLAELVRKRDPDMDYAQSLGLSAALCHLLDQIQDEGVSFDALDTLVPDAFAQHWQLILKFLDVIRTAWPAYLAAAGMIDPTTRRAMLITALAGHWRDHSPTHPLIIAGVSGSLPYVADLMGVVAGLPNVDVILSGFDPDMDTEIADHLDSQHPHAEGAKVLARMNVAPSNVTLWAGCSDAPNNGARAWVWRQVMMPSALVSRWVDIKHTIDDTMRENINAFLKDISVIEAASQQEEAQVIAVQVRRILESPNETVHIVTPDRNLAKRIVSACARYGFDVNDSAGEAAIETPQGVFLSLVHALYTRAFYPVDLIALLRHPLFDTRMISQQSIDELDRVGLRGIAPAQGRGAFLADMERRSVSVGTREQMAAMFDVFAPLFEDAYKTTDFKSRLTTYLRVAETLSRRDENDVSLLWQDEAGEVITRAFQTVLDPQTILPDVSSADDGDFITHLLSNQTVNRRGVGHPRVALLGVFESRLIAADHVILAGFNEGDWPRDQTVDPWLSRAMRHDFGLPDTDVHVGRMALDILNLVSHGTITITRARMNDGSLTVPSRWLQRLDTFLSALDIKPNRIRNHQIIVCAQKIDVPQKPVSITVRPAPRPPESMRPRVLSATQIETLMRDPYGFYAQKILRLKPLDPYDTPIDGRLRGIIIHSVLERFIAQYRDHLPENANDTLSKMLDQELALSGLSHIIRASMRPRLHRALMLYLVQEKIWRSNNITARAFESTWEMPVNIDGKEHKITARIDRLDTYKDGQYAVLDYKTAAQMDSRKFVENGISPQLSIEMMMVERGVCVKEGFTFGPVATAMLVQITARGSVWQSWSDLNNEKYALETLRSTVYDGVTSLIRIFGNDATPYYPLPDPVRAPKYNDYRHLERIDEWSASGIGNAA